VTNVTGVVGGTFVTPTASSGVLGASTLPSTGNGGASHTMSYYLLVILGLTMAGGGLAGLAMYRQSKQ
jgi:hypothetical protein